MKGIKKEKREGDEEKERERKKVFFLGLSCIIVFKVF